MESIPMSNKKSTWGGARPHPPGREGGRPKGDYPLQVIKVVCTPEEKAEIEKALSTRQRAEALIVAARHAV